MKKWLDEFLSEFQKNNLKALGFKKVRRTFSRDMGDYWERFNFQGSMSNYPDVKNWRYYINLGVEFKDLEARRYWSLFPNTHWSERIESVVKEAPAMYEYNENTNKNELAEKLKGYILEASQKMSQEIKVLREYYLEKKNLEKYPFKD
jgi:hypothetical protein